MEEHLDSADLNGEWSQQFAEALEGQRARVEHFVTTQRDRLRGLEQDISETFEQIEEELQGEKQAVSTGRDELKQHRGQLEELRQQLEQQQDEWTDTHGQAAQQQQELADQLAARQAELEEVERNLAEQVAGSRERQSELEQAERDTQTSSKDLDRDRKKLSDKSAEIDKLREQLEEQQAKNRSQRRKIAKQLRAQKAEDLKELSSQRALLETMTAEGQTESQQALAVSLAQIDQLQEEQARDREAADQVREELDASHQGQQQLEQELATARHTIDELKTQLTDQSEGDEGQRQASEEMQARHEVEMAELREAHEALQRKLSEASEADNPNDALDTRIAELEDEQQRLIDRLAEAEVAASQASSNDGSDEKLKEALQRYDLAMEDIRNLNRQNKELEASLKTAKQNSSPSAAPVASDGMDWEAQKRRMLAQLEDDYGDGSEESATVRMSLEEAIKRTDEAVAVKDRFIAELQEQLEQRSEGDTISASQAAAISEALDSDDIVRQERDRLTQLQTDWEEKLRQAEVELSVERAKIARDRAQVEEKLREYEDRQPRKETSDKDTAPRQEKPTRGRWLSRLGLKDQDDS